MAEKPGVWGIDIGQSGLKALRLQYIESADQVFATAFDYVPHPKILSQPDAIPEELIPQALEKFLSRNNVHGDHFTISVPGQSALARFIQLPPVESSKISEIVKYEAKQQIPFALEDVVWDYQTLGGGTEESGFMLEAEVGLFAMKREQVMQHLKPFTDAGVEVDLIQIAPLALYNFLSFDQFGIRPGDETIAMDEYQIVLDMGADTTMLLVSNGEKIWIRNVHLGGNHFTRALTKEMKLTFAKAEHLKCNATKSPDPRAVFQALRPVFQDYVSEIQRSIGYFSSVNRDAKISRVIGLGNGFKLAGLQKFLQQNLQYEVVRIEKFSSVAGDAVLSAPLFQENILSFAVSYGLALQGLNQTRIHTSLLPREIATARTIRRKKPWAVATAAMLMAGLAFSAGVFASSYRLVNEQRWEDSEDEVKEVNQTAAQQKDNYEKAKEQNGQLKTRGNRLVDVLGRRERWLALYKAVNECLPRDVGDEMDVEDVRLKNRLRIMSITAARRNLKEWYDNEIATSDYAMTFIAEADKKSVAPRRGYVVTVQGISVHNEPDNRATGQNREYIVDSFLKYLQQPEVQKSGSTPVPVGNIGVSHATLLQSPQKQIPYYPDGLPEADAGGVTAFDQWGQPTGGSSRRGDDDDDQDEWERNRPRSPISNLRRPQNQPKNIIQLDATQFTIQFFWDPTRMGKAAKPADQATNNEQPAGQPAAN